MLTKTDFLLFLDTPMHLWAKSHSMLAVTSPTLYEQHLMTQGMQVEALAHDYLQQAILPGYQNASLKWQQAFSDGPYEIRTDALVHDKVANAYDLYEVKSSTSVKKDHRYDLAFQALVLEANLNLRHVYIVYIDNTYRHTGQLDLTGFFTHEDLTEKIAPHLPEVTAWRKQALKVLLLAESLPEFACTNPKTCPCPDLCHPDLPAFPIYNLPRIGKKSQELRASGITAIKDIPPSFILNPQQAKHQQAVVTGQPVINRNAIKKSLAQLVYPVHFLDYESFNPAVPLFEGYRPYEHIVFQYSLHVLDAPGAELRHYACLLTGSRDPAPEIVPHLLANINPTGSVVVWYQGFEKQRNQELASHCPAYADQLKSVNARLYDLMLIFSLGYYVHPDFKGSASLKAVLPVLCPDLNYDDMTISDGTQAMLNWFHLVPREVPESKREIIEQAMLAYCQLDTYGMVAILAALQNE